MLERGAILVVGSSNLCTYSCICTAYIPYICIYIYIFIKFCIRIPYIQDIYIHICSHTNVRTRSEVGRRLIMSVYIFTCSNMQIFTGIHIHIYIYTHANIRMRSKTGCRLIISVYIFTYSNMQIFKGIHVHICMYTY